jgi:hypothetical protein
MAVDELGDETASTGGAATAAAAGGGGSAAAAAAGGGGGGGSGGAKGKGVKVREGVVADGMGSRYLLRPILVV